MDRDRLGDKLVQIDRGCVIVKVSERGAERLTESTDSRAGIVAESIVQVEQDEGWRRRDRLGDCCPWYAQCITHGH